MTILIIAPHPDDEVLGCGGTIAKKIKEGHEVFVCIVTEGKPPMYSKQYVLDEYNEMENAHKILGVKRTITLGFPSAFLDMTDSIELNKRMYDVVRKIKPDEMYIPHVGDIHKDHQIVANAAMVAARPKNGIGPRRILAYETISETDWNIPSVNNAFIPNVYHDIKEFLGKKWQQWLVMNLNL